MAHQTTKFYESIVEACNRGELWGIELTPSDSIQLEFTYKSDNA